MKIDVLKFGLMDYIEGEIIAKAQGWRKFMMITAVSLATPKIDDLLKRYQDMAHSLGIVNDNGEIDVPKLHECMKQGIIKSGSFEWNGMIFDDKDVEKLFYYINKRGQ